MNNSTYTVTGTTAEFDLLRVVFEMYGFFVFIVALVLFLVLFYFRIFSGYVFNDALTLVTRSLRNSHPPFYRPVVHLFMNAVFVSLYSFVVVPAFFHTRGEAIWPQVTLFAQIMKILGEPFRGYYLYRRCMKVM